VGFRVRYGLPILVYLFYFYFFLVLSSIAYHDAVGRTKVDDKMLKSFQL
jgi:hypothetical protein